MLLVFLKAFLFFDSTPVVWDTRCPKLLVDSLTMVEPEHCVLFTDVIGKQSNEYYFDLLDYVLKNNNLTWDPGSYAMDVGHVLNRIHVVLLPDNGRPSRIYNLNGNRVQLKGQKISNPRVFQGRVIQNQTMQSSEHPCRMWEFWFVDSPRTRLRHFMKAAKADISNQTESKLSQFDNSYAQQRGNRMQVNGNGANINTAPQAMHDQLHFNQVSNYGPQQQYFAQQHSNQPQQCDQLPANCDQPLNVAQPTEIYMQPYNHSPDSVLQVGNVSQDYSTHIVMPMNIIPQLSTNSPQQLHAFVDMCPITAHPLCDSQQYHSYSDGENYTSSIDIFAAGHQNRKL